MRLSRKAQEKADELAAQFGASIRNVAAALAERAGKEFADLDDVMMAYARLLDEIAKKVNEVDAS